MRCPVCSICSRNSSLYSKCFIEGRGVPCSTPSLYRAATCYKPGNTVVFTAARKRLLQRQADLILREEAVERREREIAEREAR
jgi:hypothetical protein